MRPKPGRCILLAISGSIAAYKTPLLVRAWVRSGHQVKVLMTDAAADFVSPLSLATVAQGPVYRRYYDPETGVWANHVELANWADALVLAPASAQTLAKMAHGFSDSLLLTTYLSTTGPVFIAPAMDRDMYLHEATQANLRKLLDRPRHYLLPPEEGPLASGLEGVGRMAEPETIARNVSNFLAEDRPCRLQGKRFLVTAGPTHEPIDPVRFLGNRASGRMGYALAEALVHEGADVHLISGPSSLPEPEGVALQRVETAQDMYDAATAHWPHMDGAILSAAVADYRPADVHPRKIKKEDQEDADAYHLVLVANPDILAALAKRKSDHQLLVGFSLETDHSLEHARRKRQRKGCQMMVLNSLEDPGAGFGHDTNQVTLITAHSETPLPLLSKQETARRIVDFMITHFYEETKAS